MARRKKLTTWAEVKSCPDPGRYGLGGGLYLLVSAKGAKSWVFRYRDRVTRKHRDKGLGSIALVGLKEARAAALEARHQLASGVDPIGASKAAKLASAPRDTFGHCAALYIDSHRSSWRNAKHAAQWASTLSTHAASIKDRPVAAIGTDEVMGVLAPIWSRIPETAGRVRQRVEAVLDWAATVGLRTGDNPARWRGHIEHLLPPVNKVKAVESHPALPWAEMPALMADLRSRDNLSARALELQILTATRPNETLRAEWAEFDLESAVWTIPAARMKANREHRVPLSDAALALLRALPRVSGAVFPGAHGAPYLSSAATLQFIKRVRPGIVPHGFRSTFRDWCADCSGHSREVAEQALAHAIKDKTEAAYRRTDMLAKRAQLMREWAEHCGGKSLPATVIPFARAKASGEAG